MLSEIVRTIACLTNFQCDGVSLDLANGPRLEGIALLNIPSIYGGTNLWGENPSQKKRRKAQKAKKDKDKEFSTSSMSSAELAIAVQGQNLTFGFTVIDYILNTHKHTHKRKYANAFYLFF